MSIDTVHYNAANFSKSLLSFKNKSCSKDIDDPDFVRPTSQDVRDLRAIMGFSQVDLAVLTGASYNEKGSTTIRKWETLEGNKEARKIPLSAWRLMLIKSGVVTLVPLGI